jgi:lipoate-protein ligase B
MRPLVNVLRLGRVHYDDALSIQLQMRDKVLRASSEKRNVEHFLLLAEHEPVYTIGLRQAQYDGNIERRLQRLGADFRRTERGGKITFHGPGQLTAYPILYLGAFRTQKSLKKYVHLLEDTLTVAGRRLLASADPPVRVGTLIEHPGVWVNEQRKVAAIGVHCRRYVTMHGVSLNCDVDLAWFDHIVACDIPDKDVTSLSAELGRPVSVEQALPVFLNAFKQVFQCELLDVCG